MPRTRPLPARKSLGTDWNLRPDTERARAGALRPGDVVMESTDHPAVIHRVSYPHKNHICIHAKYVWEPPYAPTWILGTYNSVHLFDRAVAGEY